MKTLVKKPEPIIGFYGAIAAWVDVQFLCGLGTHFIVELLGPVSVEIKIPHKSSIILYKPRSHEATIELAKRWKCGLILFKQSTLTDCVDPVKLYEYMALGLPVVATRLKELENLSNDMPEAIRPIFVKDPHTAPAIIAKVIKDDTPEKQQLRKEWAFSQTWDLRLDSIFATLGLTDWL